MSTLRRKLIFWDKFLKQKLQITAGIRGGIDEYIRVVSLGYS